MSARRVMRLRLILSKASPWTSHRRLQAEQGQRPQGSSQLKVLEMDTPGVQLSCVLMLVLASCGLKITAPDGLEVAGSLRVNSFHGVRDRALEVQRTGPVTYPNSGGAKARGNNKRNVKNSEWLGHSPVDRHRPLACGDVVTLEQKETRTCSAR